jgi:hypothetical protein
VETCTTLLDEALDGWRGTRNGLIAEVKNLSAEQLQYRPRPEMRSGVELVQHIIEVGLIMGRRAGAATRSTLTAVSEHAWAGSGVGTGVSMITAVSWPTMPGCKASSLRSLAKSVVATRIRQTRVTVMGPDLTRTDPTRPVRLARDMPKATA